MNTKQYNIDSVLEKNAHHDHEHPQWSALINVAGGGRNHPYDGQPTYDLTATVAERPHPDIHDLDTKAQPQITGCYNVTANMAPLSTHKSTDICPAFVNRSLYWQQPRANLAHKDTTTSTPSPQLGASQQSATRTVQVVEPTAKVSSSRSPARITTITVCATSGTKDRHSKVRTAKGLRDRRVRLSAPTAIQFFDVQDRLGYDQPSKAVDWLIKKARAAIDDLAPAEGMVTSVDGGGCRHESITDMNTEKNDIVFVKVDGQEGSVGGAVNISPTTFGGARIESRARARERARERAKEKSTGADHPPSASVGTCTSSSCSTTQITPVTRLSHLQQPISQAPPSLIPAHAHLIQPHSAPSSYAFLPQPAFSHLLPCPAHTFHVPPTSAAPLLFHDFQPLHHLSVPPPSHTHHHLNINTTHISPRGTLQSIFINPASFSLPPANSRSYASVAVEAGGSCEGCVPDCADMSSTIDVHNPLHIHGVHGLEQDPRSTQPPSMADFQ